MNKFAIEFSGTFRLALGGGVNAAFICRFVCGGK